MSSQQDATVLARGKTWYDGNTIDQNNYSGVHLEGTTVYLPCTAAEVTKNPRIDGTSVRAVLVRNVSGTTLRASDAVVWKAGYEGRRVDGRVAVNGAAIAGIVDDHINANGVPNGDLFWLIVQGKCLARTTHTADATNVLAVGDWVVGATAANSTGNTAGGCVALISMAGSTAVLGNQILNRIGKALTARTTANSNTLTRIDIPVPLY